MSTDKVLLKYLKKMKLTRLGDGGPAGLAVVSLPVPRGTSPEWTLNRQATHVKPLGQWYGLRKPSPRRLFLAADTGGKAPDTISVSAGKAKPSGQLPVVSMETFAHAEPRDLELEMYWEDSLLKIEWGNTWVGLAMGMDVKGEIHWWEHCNMMTRLVSPSCVEVEMGGAIPHAIYTAQMLQDAKDKGGRIPFVHQHNWVNGNIYVRAHSNGVVEVYAHHVNSCFFDEGKDLVDAVPVLGIRTEESKKAAAGLSGAFDGSRCELKVGGVSFDLTDVSRLANASKPGKISESDGFLVLQPYMGMEFYMGRNTVERGDNPYIWEAKDRIVPRGMARTLRFSMSLNPKRSARVVRYVPPTWWYGLCEEYQARSLLPVSNEYDESWTSAMKWARTYMVPDGFEEGILPHLHYEGPRQRQAPNTEGDIPAGLMLAAYHTGEAADYDCALRACCSFCDILVNHAVNHVRFPGHHMTACALPLQRTQSLLFAWLETGDLYYLNTTRAVTEKAYWWHKNSWPRRAIGRDGRFLHNFLVLYQYLGIDDYLEKARDMIADIEVVQWPDGTFGDQAGGTDVHGHASYIVKPWMGMMGTMGVYDYLELFPGDKRATGIAKRFADWMMRERTVRPKSIKEPDEGTGTGWTYQHKFKGKKLPGVEMPVGPSPGQFQHMDFSARTLPWFSFVDGNPDYFDAFAQSYGDTGKARQAEYCAGTGTLIYLPWLQARLWNARVTSRGIEVNAVYLGERTPKTGRIITPDGPKDFTWTAPGKLSAPRGIRVTVTDLTRKRNKTGKKR